jgi:hypothetical protein
MNQTDGHAFPFGIHQEFPEQRSRVFFHDDLALESSGKVVFYECDTIIYLAQ